MAFECQLLVRVHPACPGKFRELLGNACGLQALVEPANHFVVLEASLRDHHKHRLSDSHQTMKNAEWEALLAVMDPVRFEPLGLSVVLVPRNHPHHRARWHHATGAAGAAALCMLLLPLGQLPEHCDVGSLTHPLNDLPRFSTPPRGGPGRPQPRRSRARRGAARHSLFLLLV